MGQEAKTEKEKQSSTPVNFSSLKVCLVSKKKLPKKQMLSQQHDLSAMPFTSTSLQIIHS